MKTFLAVVVALLLVALISLGGWTLARGDKTAPEIVRLTTELKNATAKISQLKDELAAEKTKVAKLELEKSSKVARALTSSSSATSTPPSDPTKKPASSASGPAEVKNGPLSAMRKMFDSPQMREMVKQQSKVQIDMLFGKLFERFQLTPEEKDNFKDLLAARQALQTDMGFKLMDKNLTPEQRKQINADYETAKMANDDLIKTFLGDDADFATFKHWEDTQPERMAFEMMGGRAQFSTAGEPLSSDQEQKLIDMMAEIRKAPSALPDMTNPKNFSPENITEEQINAQLQKLDNDAARVLQEAAKILTPGQLEALKKFQTNARTMSEAGMKMWGSMSKNGK